MYHVISTVPLLLESNRNIGKANLDVSWDDLHLWTAYDVQVEIYNFTQDTFVLLIRSTFTSFAPLRPRSVTAKTSELYDELKLRGFSWFDDSSSTEIDNDNDQDTFDSYSVMIDNDTEIRKRMQRNIANGIP